MPYFIKVVRWIAFILILALPLSSLALMMTEDKIKPTASFTAMVDPWAQFFTVATFLIASVGVLWFVWIKADEKPFKELILFAAMPIVFAFMCYQLLHQAIPLIEHTFSPKSEHSITVIIQNKHYNIRKGSGFACTYQLEFQHPKFNRHRYACIDRVRWEAVFVGRPMTLYVEQSPYAYTIKKVVLPYESVSKDDP